MNNTQLTFAREFRGMTQTELSGAIKGLSQSNLSKFEKGLGTLSESLVQKVMDYLDFPYSFMDVKINIESENSHFRKRSSILKRDLKIIDRSYKIIGHIIDCMADTLEFPDFKLKAIDLEDGYTPEMVAIHTRKLLGLNNEAVSDINTILENHGIIVYEMSNAHKKFDGVSFLTDKGYPVIVINKSYSADRKRFTIAHELGHLLMHVIDSPLVPVFRDKEDEANRFSSEFLMPEKYIKNHLQRLKLSDLADLKKYWLTSMSSIVRRARDLNKISDRKYKYFLIEMSRLGYRKDESHIPVSIDQPNLIKKAYDIFKNSLRYSDSDLSKMFSLSEKVVKEFLNPDTFPFLKVVN